MADLKTLLVLAPHADDEVLGCGGTIARFAEDGCRVIIAVLTNAAIGAPELFTPDMIDNVRSEALRAHEVLGVDSTLFLDLPAPQLEQYPQYKVANAIAELVSEFSPQTLFVPHRGDLHKDHQAVFNAAMVAARPQNGNPLRQVFAYETLSETDWAGPFPESAFVPNVFIMLSEGGLEKKLEAMRVFSSQLRDFPHARSIEALTALARLRGSTVGASAAEAFCLVRQIY